MMMKMKRGKISGWFYLMVIPLLVFFFALHTVPFLQGLFYSFTDWKGYGSWKLSALHNYTQMFRDPRILAAYLFTFKMAIACTVLVNCISLTIACGLNAKIRGKGFLRAVFFLPNILGTLVVSYVFKQIFANILPIWGRSLGIPALETSILGGNYAWAGILIVTVWLSCAFNTIIYLSGLQSIDQNVYEAAAIDGSSGFQTFWKITFPLLAPFFTINMVLSAKSFLMMFDQVQALTAGGPGSSTETIALLIYKRGFSGGQFAYQNANAVVLFLIVVAVAIFQMKVLERRENNYV